MNINYKKHKLANLSQLESIMGNNTDSNQSVANAYILNLQPFLKINQIKMGSYLRNIANKQCSNNLK